MTKTLLDDQEVTIDCPHCKAHIIEKIGRLKNDPLLKCSSCGSNIQIQAADLKEKLGRVDKQLADLAKKFSGTIKLGS